MTTSFDFYDSLWQWNDKSNHNELPGSLLGLSPSSIRVLKNLLQRPAVPDTSLSNGSGGDGLFASRHGHLNVLLTRRSKTMRTYAGETALPGGKMEPKDSTLEETARREAQEECGITRNPDKVIKLTSLDPFLTRSNLIVTPIVFFLPINFCFSSWEKDPIPKFNISAYYFCLATIECERRPITRSFEITWFSTKLPYKLFEFPSKHSPILGFTADVLIEVAVLGYQQEPASYTRKSDGQLSMNRIIEIALKEALNSDQMNICQPIPHSLAVIINNGTLHILLILLKSFQNSPTFFGFQSLFYLGHLSSLSQAAQKSKIQQRREAKFAEALKTGGASKKIGSNEIKAPKSKLPLTLIYGFLALFLGGLIFEFLRLII
ncbi:hypothetical protein PSHT_10783 [Puccinia striiformis]|uniref:Nudix hydrolase domain-containing protein n=1 Tax=Puccinia striiformis TaxID=27350 RepID=A0A2S4V7L2_9BASI|nr:hypothetical protein PSHT_10783 [Puccinia striiformis]